MPSRLTEPSHLVIAALSFLAGACATVATQSEASPAPEPAAVAGPAPSVTEGATVVASSDAPMQTAPSGKAKIWHLARGQNAYIGKLEMDAGGAVPEHRDTTEEFIHVLEGTGTLSIEDQVYELAPGTTVYMPANAKVSYQNGDAKMVALQVFSGPDPSAKYEGWTSAP
jgi:quercetin dioxygenase-like cupin family protein